MAQFVGEGRHRGEGVVPHRLLQEDRAAPRARHIGPGRPAIADYGDARGRQPIPMLVIELQPDPIGIHPHDPRHPAQGPAGRELVSRTATGKGTGAKPERPRRCSGTHRPRTGRTTRAGRLSSPCLLFGRDGTNARESWRTTRTLAHTPFAEPAPHDGRPTPRRYRLASAPVGQASTISSASWPRASRSETPTGGPTRTS